ncbi:MAG: PrgI family protein [Parcubacteria group bacterium]
MRYQFPQFIETQTKLVGPFTLFQFLFIAAGGAAIFILNAMIGGTIFVILAIIIAVLAVSLAFLKINDITLPQYFLMMLGFSFSQKKYTFSKNLPSDIVYSQRDKKGFEEEMWYAQQEQTKK